MPRKSATTEPTERRVSSRIAALPKKEEPVKPAKAKAPVSAVKGKGGKENSKPASDTDSKKRKTAAADDGEVDGKPKSADAKKPKADADAEKPGSKAKPSSSSTSGKKQLQVGDALPGDLVLNDEAGNEVKICELKKVVIFLYPKANTPGCTKQGQCYRDEYSLWQEVGFSVYGLSNDNATPLKNWKEKQSFPYKLISDPERLLISRLTGNASKTIRSHAVVDSKGKLVDIKLGVSPAESSKSALEAAKKAA